jgi:hypothetical protein
MYFFDIEDYINTGIYGFPNWYNNSIIAGGGGSNPWQGFVPNDFADYSTTAYATADAYIKALDEYITASMEILNEPSGSTINNLYYNEFFDAYEDYMINRKIFFNSLYSNQRLYELRILDGSFSGTYEQFWDLLYDNGNGSIYTGTTTSYYNRPMESGGSVSTPMVTNYGSPLDTRYKDEYFDNHQNSVKRLLELAKIFMVLIDNDDFADFPI